MSKKSYARIEYFTLVLSPAEPNQVVGQLIRDALPTKREARPWCHDPEDNLWITLNDFSALEKGAFHGGTFFTYEKNEVLELWTEGDEETEEFSFDGKQKVIKTSFVIHNDSITFALEKRKGGASIDLVKRYIDHIFEKKSFRKTALFTQITSKEFYAKFDKLASVSRVHAVFSPPNPSGSSEIKGMLNLATDTDTKIEVNASGKNLPKDRGLVAIVVQAARENFAEVKTLVGRYADGVRDTISSKELKLKDNVRAEVTEMGDKKSHSIWKATISKMKQRLEMGDLQSHKESQK